jgi:hypothetical protein
MVVDAGFGCARTLLHFLGVEMGMHSELRLCVWESMCFLENSESTDVVARNLMLELVPTNRDVRDHKSRELRPSA